jgi:hypothetical protein
LLTRDPVHAFLQDLGLKFLNHLCGPFAREAFFGTDGDELWVVARGENCVGAIDPDRDCKAVRGVVLFRPDGKFAVVPSSSITQRDVATGASARTEGAETKSI